MVSTAVARRNNGKSARDRLVEGEQILARYNNGAKVSQLMEEFGLSHGTVHNRITEALKARIAPTVDEYRAAQDALLDDQMTKIEEQIDAARQLLALGVEQKDASVIAAGMNQRLRAIEVRTKIAERRARLWGLDAPVKAEVQVTVSTPIDLAVDELAKQLQDA